jgi:hypothetical protein
MGWAVVKVGDRPWSVARQYGRLWHRAGWRFAVGPDRRRARAVARAWNAEKCVDTHGAADTMGTHRGNLPVGPCVAGFTEHGEQPHTHKGFPVNQTAEKTGWRWRTLSVDRPTKAAIERMARERGIPQNEVVRQALELLGGSAIAREQAEGGAS